MQLFQDDGTRLRPVPDSPDGRNPTPRIIDSWLVLQGQVRAWARHRARFDRSLQELGFPRADGFWTRVAAALPRTGAWFPRVEADEHGQLWLRVRPAPPLGTQVRLWSAGPDPRRHPTLKGPDLGELGRRREAAITAGADEAVLTRDGDIVEGTTTCLLWWDGDTLCRPDPALPSLPGVTAELVLAQARARGIRVEQRRARPEHLHGLEIWTLNALHGIRPVTEWVGIDIQPGPIRRAAAWQDWLTAQRAPLPGH